MCILRESNNIVYRIVDGGAENNSSESEDEADNASGVVRGTRRKQKERLSFEHTKSLKSKWEQGDVETAEGEKVTTAKNNKMRNIICVV
jgi:hypothetical protein